MRGENSLPPIVLAGGEKDGEIGLVGLRAGGDHGGTEVAVAEAVVVTSDGFQLSESQAGGVKRDEAGPLSVGKDGATVGL